jgi:two-component system LytT family sensor kinase
MNKPTRRALLLFGIWSIPVAFLLIANEHERRAPLFNAFIMQAVPWYYWALVTLPIIRRAARRPIPRTMQAVLGYLVRGFAVGAVCGVLAGLTDFAFGDMWAERRHTPMEYAVSRMVFWGSFGLLIHSVLTGVGVVISTQRTLHENEVNAAQLQAQLADAQLSALRAQLEPHFLFNTLNTIAMYIRDGDSATSLGLLTRLSDLLRRVLDMSGQQVPLATEVDHAQRYLEIEAVRFKDRLSLEFDIAKDTETALVPNLLLQPLVENAVKHGLSQRAAAGRISVRARRDNGNLRIDVYNDGPQLDDDWMSATGIGVRNTMLRLQHLYGDQARLSLTNVDSGVLCEVVLPFQT